MIPLGHTGTSTIQIAMMGWSWAGVELAIADRGSREAVIHIGVFSDNWGVLDIRNERPSPPYHQGMKEDTMPWESGNPLLVLLESTEKNGRSPICTQAAGGMLGAQTWLQNKHGEKVVNQGVEHGETSSPSELDSFWSASSRTGCMAVKKLMAVRPQSCAPAWLQGVLEMPTA